MRNGLAWSRIIESIGRASAFSMEDILRGPLARLSHSVDLDPVIAVEGSEYRDVVGVALKHYASIGVVLKGTNLQVATTTSAASGMGIALVPMTERPRLS
jgi:hypothetical protein